MSPRNSILCSSTFSTGPSSCLHWSAGSKVPSRKAKKPPRLVLQRTWPHSPSPYADGEWSRWVGSTKPCQVCLEQDNSNSTQRFGVSSTRDNECVFQLLSQLSCDELNADARLDLEPLFLSTTFFTILLTSCRSFKRATGRSPAHEARHCRSATTCSKPRWKRQPPSSEQTDSTTHLLLDSVHPANCPLVRRAPKRPHRSHERSSAQHC